MCEKLGLGPDSHVLEIGCGWGGFALHAAGEFGARVTGLTLSEEQAALARERAAAAGLADRIEIRLQDYRTQQGRFTHIASIEMLEAIGHEELPVFFGACERLLAPGGVACIQTIAVPDQRYERYRRGNDWIREYIFPGAVIPSLEAISKAMTRSSELIVHDAENIGIPLRAHAPALARALPRQPRRGARPRLRRALHPRVGVLPRLLRGRLPHPRDPRLPARADPPLQRPAAR